MMGRKSKKDKDQEALKSLLLHDPAAVKNRTPDRNGMHIGADRAIADILEAEGYEETAKEYRRMCDNEFWYG